MAGCLVLQDLSVAPTEDRVQRYCVHSTQYGRLQQQMQNGGGRAVFWTEGVSGRGRVQAEMGGWGCFRRKKC